MISDSKTFLISPNVLYQILEYEGIHLSIYKMKDKTLSKNAFFGYQEIEMSKLHKPHIFSCQRLTDIMYSRDDDKKS